MSIVLRALSAPITDITGPLYHLIRGDIKPNYYHYISGISPQQEQLSDLFLALLRTATVAALFFVTIPCKWILWSEGGLSAGAAFAVQFLIHPYAASLLNAFVHGYPLILKVVNFILNHQLTITTFDFNCAFRMFAFCLIAQGLKNYPNGLDDVYSIISLNLGVSLGKPPPPQPKPRLPFGYFDPLTKFPKERMLPSPQPQSHQDNLPD